MREASTFHTIRRTWVGMMLAMMLPALLPAQAPAATYGDISVTLEEDLRGESNHGYVELWLLIVNRSETTNHEVKLTLPKYDYYAYGDHLRAITRTIAIEAGKTIKVPLAYPVNQTLGNTDLGVTVDGKDYDEGLNVRALSSGTAYGRSSRSGTVYSSTGSPASARLLLCSNSVDSRFIDRAKELRDDRRVFEIEATPVKLPGGHGSLPVDFSHSMTVRSIEFFRPDKLKTSSWSPNWLGYSRYDGVVVTAEDLRIMPAEVRSALGQYVECGGVLLILGADALMPGHWKPLPIGDLPLSGCAAGLGYCYVSSEKQYEKMNFLALGIVLNDCQRTAAPWMRISTLGEANRLFPVIEDTLGVPIWGFLGLLLAFSIVIGPVNVIVLARRKRKLWLFWTVPLLSSITCLVVLGYMLVVEGTTAKTRVEVFTVLDENSRRATTIGWMGTYTPMLGGNGLHFSPQTEVCYQNNEDSGSSYGYRRRRNGSALTIDWTHDQNLASGWQTPRVPSHFTIRKGETRRERVTIELGKDGMPEAVNGLGATIIDFWYLDDKGDYFSSHNIPAGGKAKLSPIDKPKVMERNRTLRAIYFREWIDVAEKLKTTGPEFLTPRTYLAVMDSAPFLDEPAAKGSGTQAKSVIFGILKEGNDGG